MWLIRGKRLIACFFIIFLSLLATKVIFPLPPIIRYPRERLANLAKQLRKNLIWHNIDAHSTNYTKIVVFGDSWVDSSLIFNGMARKTWPEVLCKEIHCSSYVSYAVSQPLLDSLIYSPTGVYISNKIQLAAHMSSDPFFNASNLLPDLESQINSYLASSSTIRTPGITFLVVSIGFWDIYSLANLSREVSLVAINQCFEEILTHINKLHGVDKMLKSIMAENIPHEFRVILPKVPDPTLSPGWLSQRPFPLRPSTIAEQQKNAVYLAERWNHKLETLSRLWASTQSSIFSENSPLNKTTNDMNSNLHIPDFPELLQKLALNYYHQVAPTQVNKSIGIGKPAFKSVNEACVQLERSDKRRGTKNPDSKYLNICSQPDDYLWWDAWHVGAVGNSILGAAENAVPRI